MGFGKRLVRRVGCGCLGILGLVVLILLVTPLGHTVLTLYRRGYLDAYVSPDEERKYQAGEVENLKALYTAMNLYHESEGQYPYANGWMDVIKSRTSTSDLAKGEAEKKFISPALAGKPGQFGYAMNDKASAKYKGDLKTLKEPLLFVSSDTSRNAHGDPKKLTPNPPRPGGNVGIAVDGTIVKL